jgi:hypothetical protein
MTPGDSVTIRLAGTHEAAALARLAELDSATTPIAPALVAEVAGEVLAAISLADGVLVANPFRRTADVVELLRARERQLRAGGRRRRLAALPAWPRLRSQALG